MNKRTLFAGMLFAAVLFSGCGDGVADSSDMGEASRGEISGVVSAEKDISGDVSFWAKRRLRSRTILLRSVGKRLTSPNKGITAQSPSGTLACIFSVIFQKNSYL